MRFETWVERQIREAQERGEFDDLPGAGQPLPGLTGQYDELWWVKRVAEREHLSLLPPTLALRKEAEELLDDLPSITSEETLRDLVADYNTRRPHQAIAMLVPAQRFQPPTAVATPMPAPAVQPRQPVTVGPTEITRRVSASGLIGVCYQQVSAGRHLAGHVVTVRLHPTVLQVFFAGQLIRTVPRRSTKEVVQLRAHRPHQPKRRPTPN